MIQPAIKCIRWSKRDIEVVRNLISVQGLPYNEVASRYGVTIEAMKSLCQRNGIKRPTKAVKSKHRIYNYGNIVEKHCEHCGEVFLSKERLEKKFCNQHCAITYHNHKVSKSEVMNSASRLKRKEFLVPPVSSIRCHAKGCDTFAVPSHKVCYSHAR